MECLSRVTGGLRRYLSTESLLAEGVEMLTDEELEKLELTKMAASHGELRLVEGRLKDSGERVVVLVVVVDSEEGKIELLPLYTLLSGNSLLNISLSLEIEKERDIRVRS